MRTVLATGGATATSPLAGADRGDLPLFLFGTLRHPALFEVVFGRPQHALACRPALLHGHAARRVDGADFPVLVAAAACRQPGLLVDGLAPEEVARAVFYESTGYRLEPVRLGAAGGTLARAFLPTGRLPVSGERWRLAAWRRRHGARVVIAAALAFEHYGRIDAAGFEALWPQIERETAARLADTRPAAAGMRRGAGPRLPP
jgi:ADP-ribose pyrophosphatase